MSDAPPHPSEPPRFSIHSEAAEPASIVAVRGEIDLTTAGQLEEALRAAAGETGAGVILDLDEVEFIDSSGLRALILSAERLGEQGKELRIACGPDGAVRRVLNTTGLAESFLVHESREDAVAAFASQ